MFSGCVPSVFSVFSGICPSEFLQNATRGGVFCRKRGCTCLVRRSETVPHDGERREKTVLSAKGAVR